jgi:hypothetical protein
MSLDGFVGWMRKTYLESVASNKHERDFSKFISSTVSYPLNRAYAFINLKYLLGMYKSGYTYMPLTVTNNTTEAIFASVYWWKQTPMFTCLSPSFESSKGEFRDSFCSYNQVTIVFDKYPHIMGKIEDQVKKVIMAEDIAIKYDTYTGNRKFDKELNEQDLDVMATRVLSCSIFIIMYKKAFTQIQIHMHKPFLNIVSIIINEQEITNLLFKHYADSKAIYNALFRTGTERPYGQKLTPMTVGEVISIDDVTYKVWRELLISYAVSDMVINYISPTFAIGSNWTYIEKSDATMFDNLIIKERMKSNKEVSDLIIHYKKLYEISGSIDNVEKYRHTLLDEIADMNKNKLLSDISLARIDENVGLTLGTLPYTVKTADVVPPHYHKFLMDKDYFHKYLFDILYGCHVIHTKIGIINFDLHLNNVTIMKAASMYKTNVDERDHRIKDYTYDRSTKYCTAYLVNDIDETYIMPFDGYYGCIIDFSDAVVNTDFLQKTRASMGNMDVIIDRERDDIYNKLASVMNYAAREKDKVKAAIISNYDDMFRAISAIDYVIFLRKLRSTFENELGNNKDQQPLLHGEKRRFYMNPDNLQTLKDFEAQALELLLENVQRVVTKDFDTIPYVGEVLLQQFFNEYLYRPASTSALLGNTQLYEVYNYNAPLKYSVDSYQKYPPWAKREWVVEKFGKQVADHLFGGNVIPEFYRDTHLAYIIESTGQLSDTRLAKNVSSLKA